jgi:hypothetical protein
MAAISGQKTITAAGTEEALGTQSINGPLMIKALPTNTGNVYLGNAGDGTVSSSTGLVLGPGDAAIFEWVAHLSALLVDSAVNGEGVSWIQLSV